MSDFETLAGKALPAEYVTHPIFTDLRTCAEVYEILSDLVFGYVSRVRGFLGNLDSSFFDSLAGTIESSSNVLLTGRIADAYTLLRRFQENSLLHVYVMLQFEERAAEVADGLQLDATDSDFEKVLEAVAQMAQRGVYVEQIEDWMTGKKSLPELRIFSQAIKTSPGVVPLNFLFDSKRYKSISDRCNGHVHINFFRNLRLNHASAGCRAQLASLDEFAGDFRDLFVRHMAYVFSIHPHYMMASDYVDALECEVQPDEDSQYWVAPIVQEVFDKIVTPNRPDVTDFIRLHSGMELR